MLRAASLGFEPEGTRPMKLLCTVLGLALIVVAVMYFMMPADALPSFFPGHEAGVTRMHYKHGIVSAVVGVVLLAVGWFMGRR
jgi:hypothetical protein